MPDNLQPNGTTPATSQGIPTPETEPVRNDARLPVYADVLLAAWLLFVAACFWGPFLGFPLPPNLAAIGYAAMLIVSLVTLALGLLRSRTNASLPAVPPVNGKAGAP